jgi:hypothetical protein
MDWIVFSSFYGAQLSRYLLPHLHLRTETDPVSETSCSLEYQTMEKVQKPSNSDCMHFFINMVLDHLLPSTQPQCFLEWTCTSFEQSLVEFYTILLEEYLQVALKLLEAGICYSL